MQQPRQQYGLGSLVKKAVRGVKKIVKSPLGKAAIIGGLGMIPFGASGTSMFGRLGGMLKGVGAARNLAARVPDFVKGTAGQGGFFKSGLGRFLNPWSSGKFSGKHAFGLLGAGAVAAPFLANMFGKEEPEEIEESWTQVPSSIADIRSQAVDHYRNPSSSTLAFMPGKQFVQPNFYAADGGRAGFSSGGLGDLSKYEIFKLKELKYDVDKYGVDRFGGVKVLREILDLHNYNQGGRVGLVGGGEPGQEQIEQMLMAEFVKYKNQGGTLTFEQFVQAIMQQQEEGQGMEQPQEVMMAANGGSVPGSTVSGYTTPAGHNRFDYYSGGDPVRVGKQEGGIMETEVAEEMIDLGGKEKDYRETGGFVDLGGKERADDVPARLSKNEFVFTADAVRNAGGGDIDKGSEVMQNLMDNLEAGGEVSEDSQGLEGAQAMYDQQQMLQSRVI